MNRPIQPHDVNRGDLPLPLYEHVKRQISESILTGLLPEGALLPTEAVLAAQYGVAVGTVRHALAGLSAEGLVSRRRRTGTVVTGRAPQHSLRFFFHYFRLHAADGGLVQSDTATTAVGLHAATRDEALALALEPDAAVIRIERLRHVDGRPAMHDAIVLPAARVPDFPLRVPDVPPLLYLHLLHRYGLRIAAVRETLTADLASAADRRALVLPRPSAVLRITATAYDPAGAPVLLGRHTAGTERHVYVNEVR